MLVRRTNSGFVVVYRGSKEECERQLKSIVINQGAYYIL